MKIKRLPIKTISLVLIITIGTVFLLYSQEQKATNKDIEINRSSNLFEREVPSDRSTQSPTTERSNITETSQSNTPSKHTTDTKESTIIKIKSIQPINTQRKTPLAGSIHFLEFENLQAETVSKIDLSEYDFESLALVWERDSIYYSFTDPQKDSNFTKSEEADDSELNVTKKVSELINPDQDKPQFLYIKTETSQDFFRIDLIQPTPSVEMPKRRLSATDSYNLDSGAKYTTLQIVSRDQWGGEMVVCGSSSITKDIDDPTRLVWQPEYHPVSRIVVHHTATPNNPSDPAATVRSIYLYHACTRGWGDIGYNFLIDQNGRIYEGKFGGDEAMGYHAYTEANAMSVGISLIGDFTYTTPSGSARDSLAKLMAEKAVYYDFNLKRANGTYSQWMDPNYSVFMHRDTYFWCRPDHDLSYRCPSGSQWIRNATACPGTSFTGSILDSVVSSAKTYQSNRFDELKDIVEEAENLSEGEHNPDRLFVYFDKPQDTSESEILNLIPAYSGITDVEVRKNIAIITVRDWDNGGIVPPYGWTGYYADDTFFPVGRGTDDRIETLLKYFELRSDIKGAGFDVTREFNEKDSL